jgi:threonine dehydrogenase-like Zn-dependent dehydrogenase
MRRIVARSGLNFTFEEFALPALGERDVRVAVEFAAPKHGTETKILTDSPFVRKQWDDDLRMFLPRGEGEAIPAPSVRGVGNMVVGTVTDVGPDVARFSPGSRVFGYGPLAEAHQAPDDRWFPLGKLTPQDAVCVDPAHVAFVAVRDGNIRIGDDVAVYGLGAIGLLAVQAARAAGAHRVFAVDPIAARREVALAHGADAAWDPMAVDVALAIKHATEGAGVDVAMETSGNSRALHEAIRCARQCGTVVHVPFGPHGAVHLNMDEEFHHNRITIIGSQASAYWRNPDRDHPRWTAERAFAATIDCFRRGLLTGAPIVTPIVPFADAIPALEAAFTDPGRAIKLGVRIG